MAKQLNVNLAFTADTGRAKAQLKDLQNQLTQVINLSTKDIGGEVMAQDIEKASLAAAQLKAHLEDATNVKTGKLDLGKLSETLDTKKLKSYRNSLQAIGIEGQKAFMMLAQSITDAEVPLRRTSNLMSELWVTMKNTARWQFTSSAMHGFMSAVSSAYGYAQDLNESLNNIRIVSGQNTEQIAKFAEQANKAAKALNTTTTNYTNAALIYYQQGLSDSEIEERTNITIKMANVARQSAEVVSDQLTAVWNNFYKQGEEGLAYYADIMTALGAETASSTDEIAAGLEKFASIADMIGLSFEYAASSLATITATTRQSPEVVGTALKTIFARIQGLKLGETLEDGTDLNKYSDSLKRVGIEIFDTAGELKDMDIILEEIGNRWDQLGKSEQVALAQAVAGVRQYNQLVSLMDNWDYFQENLSTARSSEGALDEQAKIYEESWEAASNRVRAAMESIYSDIIKDEAFINMLDNIEKVLRGIDKLIDSIGGLNGVIAALGAIGTKVFHDQMTASLKNIAYSINMTFGLGKEKAADLQKTTLKEAEKFAVEDASFEGGVKADVIRTQANLQRLLLENSSKMSQEEIKQNQTLLDRVKIYGEIASEQARGVQRLQEEEEIINARLSNTIRRRNIRSNGVFDEQDYHDNINFYRQQSQWVGNVSTQLNRDNKTSYTEQEFDLLLKNLTSEGADFSSGIQDLESAFKDVFKAGGTVLRDEIIDYVRQELENTEYYLQEQFGIEDRELDSIGNTNFDIGGQINQTSESLRQFDNTVGNSEEHLTNFKGEILEFSDVIVSAGQILSSGFFIWQTFGSIIETLNNPDLSTWDKVLAIMTSLTTIAPILINALTESQLLWEKHGWTITKNSLASAINTLAIKKGILTRQGESKAIQISTGKIIENTAAWDKNTLAILGQLGIKFAPFIGGIMAIGVAVWGIVEAWKAWYATTPEGKLKAVKEAAAEAETAFNDVATAINEVRDSIDSLESSYDKIANLTKGTLEWHQAISDVNAEVLNLIDKYPELSNSLQIDENGILSIPEDKLEELEKQLISDLTSARNISLIAQQEENRAQQVVDRQGYNTTLSTSWDEMTVQTYTAQDEQGNPYEFQSLGYEYSPMEILQAAEQIYAKPDIGAQLFTDEYLEVWAKELGVNSEALKELIYANEKLIIEMSAMTDSIEAQDEVLLKNRLNDYGSNMSYEEALELTGEESYADYVDTFKGQVKLTEADYQDYAESIGAEFEGAKDGRLYYKKKGQEESDSIDISVLEGIKAEDLANKALYQKVVEKARDNVSALGLKDDENLSDESYIHLDNLQRNIGNFGETLGWTEEETIQSQKAIQSTLGIEKGEFSEEQLNERLSKWGNIERSAENLRIFEKAVQDLNESANSAEGIEKFTHTMDKLAASAEIDNMSSIFETAGKSFGLNDEEIDQMQNYAKYISDISEESEDLSDNLATDAEASADVAIQISRMNKGVETLAEGFKDWNSILRKSSKESKEYSDALNDTRSALSDVLGVEEEFIENDFIEQHLDDIKLAAEGNGAAIDRLKQALATDIILNVQDVDKFEDLPNDLQNAITNMQSILDNANLEIGDSINLDNAIKDFDSESFLAECNKIVSAAGMSVEEAQAYFNSLGFEPEFVTEEKTVKRSIPQERTHTDYIVTEGTINIGGAEVPFPTIDRLSTTYIEGYKDVNEKIQVPAMSSDGKTPQIKSLNKLAPGSSNNYSQKNSGGPKLGGGGGGNKGSKVKKTKRSDIVERYKEITDQLDDIQDAASDTAKEMDRLYGANRLKAIDKQNSLIQKEISLLKAKRAEALNYLKIDRKALEVAAQKAGVNLEIGADGNIANYTTALNSLFDQLEAAENAAGETADEAEQKKIEAIQEKIEELKSAISQYDETRELLEDLNNELEDKFNEWQDNNYEKLTYSLELKLEINDMELERIDYFLNKFADNFYKIAESAGLLMDQIEPNTSNIEENKIHKDELDTAYQAGEISQADYIEGLKNVRQNLYSTLEALNELDKTMLHYYEDTLAAATSELADHTDHMEHLTSVFEHYINLMNILGKSKNYDAIGDFLGGKADTIRDRLEVAKSYYNMLLEQKEDVEAKLNMAIARGDDAAIELYREEWDAIVDEVDAAQEEVLSLTEEWSEAMKAVIENNMAKIAETLEKTLTNGINFDELMDGFDKLNTRQEEYLTKTNQIYETNKLMRTANKALDETDNAVAKQKLKNFIEETKSLQNNTKLSEYELEIQKAKYDLLLAEIALEEAQNAKSTVRMSKDNEGNFGYVFTADQDEIDDAQQSVDDAENRLYNLSLEGQQEYTQKYLQAQQEMYNELTNLQQMYLDGQIASEEEYNRRKEEILNHYLNPVDGILSTYSHLFNIAVQTDADATADYWAKDYAAMTQNTEDWKIAVNKYLVEVEEETDEWKRVSEQANNDVQNALENSSEATRELTEESEYLAEMVNREVIPAIEDELDWVAEITEAYANQRAEILALIEATEEYLRTLEKTIAQEAKYDKNKDYAFSAVDKAISGDYEGAGEDVDTRVDKVYGETGKTQDQSKLKNIIGWTKTLNDEERAQADKVMNRLETYGYGSDSVEKEMMKLGYKPNIKYYDTGGYTGAWGPEGKLAVLHEKELVLNADDTSNLLAVVSFVRDLVGIIDSQAQMQGLTNISPISTISNMNQTLEQQVSIHAEFPNATDRFEIEEAFSSLVNRASQYANRK